MASPLAKFEKKSSCHTQQHLSCAEFGLWEQYRKLSFTSGQLFEAVEHTAERFAEESRSSIYRLRSKLAKKGWLVIAKKSKRGKNGQLSPTIFRVLDHEEWVEKHGTTECRTPVPEVKLGGSSPVPEMKSTSSKSEIDPVPKVERRFEINHSEKKAGLKIPHSSSFDNFSLSDAEQNAQHVKQAPVPEMKQVGPEPVPKVKLVEGAPTLADLEAKLNQLRENGGCSAEEFYALRSRVEVLRALADKSSSEPQKSTPSPAGS